MKNSKSIKPRSLKGTGYIIGAIIGIVAAITAFVFTENIAIAIPVFAGLSIPLGMIIEQKFEDDATKNDPRQKKLWIALIVVGVLLFLSIFISKFI
jgi:4-hydroxybenzoate polyprenyltransferase